MWLLFTLLSLSHIQRERRLLPNCLESENTIKSRLRCLLPPPSRHLFCRNATPKWGKWTPFSEEKHYFCAMGNMIETLTKEEQAIFIVALFLLLFAIVMGYAMVQDYRIYLDENYKARYSFCDFIKRGRYYIYLFFGLTFVIILGFTVYLMAMREYM